jgi:hypothetical protein
MDEASVPSVGMTISVRVRRDVVVVDPQRFLAAARRAYRELNPDVSEAEVAEVIVDAVDAAYALLERFGQLAPDDPDGMWGRATVGDTSPGDAGRTGAGGRDLERPDGLSPAGWRTHVVLNDAMSLQDYGCFGPEDPFALPGGSGPHE